MAHDVFISYSVEDKPTADAVCATLESQRIRCWIAPRDVLPGEDYAAALIEAINESSVVILVFSSKSNNSPHVIRELERAVSKSIPILPLRIEDVPPSRSMEYFISGTHWLDALTPPLEKHLENIARRVKLLLSRLATPQRVVEELEAPEDARTVEGKGKGPRTPPLEAVPTGEEVIQPRIQYAQTKDGVSIAFWTLGEGHPFLELPMIPVSLGESVLQVPSARAWYDHLAQTRQAVTYDCRGSGLSDRKVADCSIDSFVLDIEAVVDCLGVEKVDLLASGGVSGQVAITFAVRNPEQVSHLIVWEAYARAHEIWNRPQTRALFGLIDTDWETATEALAYGLQGWSDAKAARRFAALVRENISQERAKTVISAASEWDVTELLPQVRSPTLVLHQRDYRFLEPDDVKVLAAGIPQARLVVLQGSGLLAVGNVEALLTVIDEFLGEGEEAAAGAKPP